jgi:hypothetical protein
MLHPCERFILCSVDEQVNKGSCENIFTNGVVYDIDVAM